MLAAPSIWVPVVIADPMEALRWLRMVAYVSILLAIFYAAVGGFAFTVAWAVCRVVQQRGRRLLWAVPSGVFFAASAGAALVYPLLNSPMSSTVLLFLVPPVIGSTWIACRWQSSTAIVRWVQRHGVEFRLGTTSGGSKWVSYLRGSVQADRSIDGQPVHDLLSRWAVLAEGSTVAPGVGIGVPVWRPVDSPDHLFGSVHSEECVVCRGVGECLGGHRSSYEFHPLLPRDVRRRGYSVPHELLEGELLGGLRRKVLAKVLVLQVGPDEAVEGADSSRSLTLRQQVDLLDQGR